MDRIESAVKYQETVVVDGEEYKIIALTPSRAFKLAVRLGKVIGEPMAALASSEDEKSAGEALPRAVGALFARMDEDQVLDLVKELACTCEIDSRLINKAMFEQHFQGRLGHLMKLVVEVVKFQFSDFTSAIAQVVAQANPGKKQVA